MCRNSLTNLLIYIFKLIEKLAFPSLFDRFISVVFFTLVGQISQRSVSFTTQSDWFHRQTMKKKCFISDSSSFLIPNFNIVSQYTVSKSSLLSYVCAIPLSDMSEERRGKNWQSWFVEKKEKEKRERFLLFSRLFNWDEPMKDFLLLFFSLFPTTRN